MMTFPIPTTPPTLKYDAPAYEALYDFVALCAVPTIPHENIIRAWQNRAHPPAHSDEMAILTLVAQERRGTNVEIFDNDTMTSCELIISRFQIDFYSSIPEVARQRAMTFAHSARTSLGIRFFADRGVGCNFATSARDMTGVGETGQFEPRWMVEIQLSYTAEIEFEHPMFDSLHVHLENVDVHHPLDRPPSPIEAEIPDVQTFADGSLPHKELYKRSDE